MRSFSCHTCGQLVFFENSRCLSCGDALGFDPDAREMRSFPVAADGTLTEPADRSRPEVTARYAWCANVAIARCNWLVPAERAGDLCRSCELTRTRPDETDAEAVAAFLEAEAAKRALVFQLLELGLPVERHDDATGRGFAFDLVSGRFEPVVTGHADGLITLDVDEADPAHRERVRKELGEAYRTILGHLRHEIGHAYWPLLVSGGDELDRFRALFGDERADYAAALDRHYRDGAPAGWEDGYVSAYATMHPWEDWAETFAHYLHIRDTLQTAAAFGIVVDGPAPQLVAVPSDDVDHRAFAAVVAEWLPLTYALNAVNRSMGRPDLYPFVLAPRVIDKLSHVHRLIAGPDVLQC